MTLSKMSCYI